MAQFRRATRSDIKILIILCTPILMLLCSAVVVSQTQNISISQLARDPVSLMDVHPFTGILSNLGILLWCMSASICLFSSLPLIELEKTGSFFLIFSFCWLSYSDSLAR